MWRYCKVPNEKVTDEMAKIGGYSSIENMRRNDTDTIVKWKGVKPRCLYGYSEIENILDELKKPEWQTNMEKI